MPKPVASIANIKKNLTPAQRAARVQAETELTRRKVRLTPPPYVKADEIAYGYWKSTVRRMRGITLLDDLDSEMLAMYCQILSRRDVLSEVWRTAMETAKASGDQTTALAAMETLKDVLQRLEAQERLAIQYGEKLGLTPSGRVRLAKRRAEEKSVDPDDDLYGGGG